METQRDVDRFLREARSAARLRHPHICPIYEFGETDDYYVIVMAYIEGETLASVLENNRLKENREIASVVQKIASAIGEAHNHGVIHRDLKPANIMIDQQGEPVVMDFGLARGMRESGISVTRSGDIVGTPAYMSPEQARGESNRVEPTSDIYSLGVILYEMLANTRPFRGSVAVVLSQILRDDPPPPSAHHQEVEQGLEHICLRAMAKKPEDRYKSMAELTEVLADYLAGTPIKYPRDSSEERDYSFSQEKTTELPQTPVTPTAERESAASSRVFDSSFLEHHHESVDIPPDEKHPHGFDLWSDHLNIARLMAQVSTSQKEKHSEVLKRPLTPFHRALSRLQKADRWVDKHRVIIAVVLVAILVAAILII